MFCIDFQQLLTQEDQLILIKAGFFEVWLTRMARLFDETQQTVLFSDGGIIQRTELEIIFTVSFMYITPIMMCERDEPRVHDALCSLYLLQCVNVIVLDAIYSHNNF